MPRCHITRNTVYNQHRSVARTFRTGYPHEFEVMVMPGYRVLYLRNLAEGFFGQTVDDSYVYEASDPDWRPFKADDARAIMDPVAAGECTLFQQLYSKPDPYRLR